MGKYFLIISNDKIILKLYAPNVEKAYEAFDSIKNIYKREYKDITLISAEIPEKPMKHCVF